MIRFSTGKILRTHLWLAVLFTIAWHGAPGAVAMDFQHQRHLMVQHQLRGRDIVDDRVLRAMALVPRHRFVPSKLQQMAYGDSPLPIGHGQTISQPYIVALMSQVLAIQAGERVLEIGTGSGYQAAVLAAMDARVFSIEIVAELGRQAEATLDSLGYDAIQLKIGDGYKGWPEHAPFDAIIVTCAPTKVPQPLKEQLAEGGRMVIPVGAKHHQQLVLLIKEQGEVRREKVVDVRFVPMVNKDGKVY